MTIGQGEYAAIRCFQRRRGQTIGFGLGTGQFDGYPVMIGPDDVGATNAGLQVTLRADGSHGIPATSLNSGETGRP